MDKLDQLKLVAKNRDGYCLSDQYFGSRKKLSWKCSFGHIWEAIPANVKFGSWCPICNEVRKDNKFKTEEMCREIFFEIFNMCFKRSRPIWLIGPKKYPLELDGLNEKLRIAFEYNGFQHYNEVNFFKINKEKIKYQREKEDLKIKKCVEHGIKLIIIPFIKNPSKEKLRKIICSLLKEQGLI